MWAIAGVTAGPRSNILYQCVSYWATLTLSEGEATLVNFGLSKNMEPETRVSEHPITLHKTCGPLRGRAYEHPKSTSKI